MGDIGTSSALGNDAALRRARSAPDADSIHGWTIFRGPRSRMAAPQMPDLIGIGQAPGVTSI